MIERRGKSNFFIWGKLGLYAGTREHVIERIFGFPKDRHAAYVALAGMPAAVVCRENAEILRVYEDAAMTIVDGMPFVKKARRAGFACERCSGPDIMGTFFQKGLASGQKHYFYGCTDEVLAKLRVNLERDYPGIEIVGMYAPPFRPLTDEEDRRIVHRINAAAPDFLWVALGAPKQEIWMRDHYKKLKGCTMLGVGAGFNFLAGTLDKAPKWVEDCSLEWVYRFLKEPRRLFKRNILGAIKYLLYSFEYWLKGGRKVG